MFTVTPLGLVGIAAFVVVVIACVTFLAMAQLYKHLTARRVADDDMVQVWYNVMAIFTLGGLVVLLIGLFFVALYIDSTPPVECVAQILPVESVKVISTDY